MRIKMQTGLEPFLIHRNHAGGCINLHLRPNCAGHIETLPNDVYVNCKRLATTFDAQFVKFSVKSGVAASSWMEQTVVKPR